MRDSENQLLLTHMTGSWGGRLEGGGWCAADLEISTRFQTYKISTRR